MTDFWGGKSGSTSSSPVDPFEFRRSSARGGGGVPTSAPDSAPSSGSTPGTYSINVLNPVGSAQAAATETENLFSGLKTAVFGTQTPDSEGSSGGLLGDVPLIGAAGRGAGELISRVPGGIGTAIGAGAALVGGTLERGNFLPGTEVVGAKDELQKQFDALPENSPAKQAALAQMQIDKGFMGTGAGAGTLHYMSKAIRDSAAESESNPQLFGGMMTMPGSTADSITNLFDSMGFMQRGSERLLAGADIGLGDSVNRLEEIKQVAAGKRQFGTSIGGDGIGPIGKAGSFTQMTPTEEIVARKVADGTWSDTQALDYLASHGAGLSHDSATQIILSVVTDPLTLLSTVATGGAALGLKGARIAEVTAGLADALKEVETVNSTLRGAAKASHMAKSVNKAANALLDVTAKTAGTSRKFNLYGRAQESVGGTKFIELLAKPYIGAQGTYIGKAAKVGRTIIDPMHAIDLHMPGNRTNTDLLGEGVQKVVSGAMGDVNNLKVYNTMVDLGLGEDFVVNHGVYGANLTRRVVAKQYRAQLWAADKLEGLRATLPGDMGDHLTGWHSNILERISEEAQVHRILAWTPEDNANLALRMRQTYTKAGKTEEEWGAIISKMNPDMKSLLHQSTYGNFQTRLIDVYTKTRAAFTGPLNDMSHRIILLNKKTLTRQGADGIIAKIGPTAKEADAIAEMRSAQILYPELNYIKIDETDIKASLDSFYAYLNKKRVTLPMQVETDELSKMPAEWQQLQNDMYGSYTLGFRPDDEYLWGLERTAKSEGALAPTGEVWTDHVGVSGAQFRPARDVPTNALGQTIPKALVAAMDKVAAPIDYIEAMGRVMRAKVTGTMVHQAAALKFVSLSTTRHGMTEAEGKAVWKGIQDYIGTQDQVFNPRGFSAGTLWSNTREIIPVSLRTGPGKMNQRDILALVLDAYDGDVRLIGATQKLTAKAKAVLGKTTGVNFAGQIAENLYPTMKFRLNSVFQFQERIEPWILNAQRGADWSTGGKMTIEDEKLSRMLQRMTDTSLNRMGDAETWEFNAGAVIGKAQDALAADPTTNMGKLKAAGGILMDTKGAKRVAMLRTFKKGLGKEIESTWEQHTPGRFDKMYKEAQVRAGHLFSKDDFAVQMIAESMLGNDVVINRLERMGKTGVWQKDFMAAISPGEWYKPIHSGEIKALELNNMLKLLDLTTNNGIAVHTQADAREALANGSLKLEDIALGLRLHGADPDYVRRMENAFNFHWDGFWGQVEKKFSLTSAQRLQLEDMVGRTAEMRGVTPVDYMSQIYSPTIIDGIDGSVGSLGDAVKLLDMVSPSGATTVPNRGLATLAGVTGTSTREDLINQLAATFSHHLDPSAKLALLREWEPDLMYSIGSNDLRLDPNEVNAMFANANGPTRMAQELTGQMAHSATDIWQAGMPTSFAETQARQEFLDKAHDYVYKVQVNGETKTVVMTKAVFGDGFLALDPELQNRFAGVLSQWAAEHPGYPMPHIQVDDIARYENAAGELGQPFAISLHVTDEKANIIILNKNHYTGDWRATEATSARNNATHRILPAFTDRNGQSVLRTSNIGVPYNVDTSPEAILRHELMHDLDNHLQYKFEAAQKRIGTASEKPEDAAFVKEFIKYSVFKRDHYQSPGGRQISEYGVTRGANEGIGELGALAHDPKFDPATHITGEPMPASNYATEGMISFKPTGLDNTELKVFLGRLDARAKNMWYEDEIQQMTDEIRSKIAAHDVLGGTRKAKLQKEIDDLSVALDYKMGPDGLDIQVPPPSDMYPPPKMTGPQTAVESVDRLRQHLTDMGAYVQAPPVSANPDMVRATQAFADWSKRVMAGGLADPANATHTGLLHDLGALDTSAGTMFNQSEALMHTATVDAMSRKWDDAHRLQYFSQSRTMFERSLNHPMFGIYPASYMWGKMLPEMTKFVAAEPFGVKTGAMAYSMLNIQRQVATQAEFDPEFRAKMEKLGSSEALWMIGYMLPAVPWDVPSAFPLWMRNLAQRGLDAQSAVDAGGVQPDNTFDAKAIATDALKPLDPSRQLNQWTSPLRDLPDKTHNTDAQASGDGPLSGMDLGPTLEEIMQSLGGILAGH